MESTTLLFRQVNPQFYKEGRVLSVAFKPSANHMGLLSVYDGDQIEAGAAWNHFTTKLGLASSGTWAVSVVEATSLDLLARPMPLEDFPEHAVIDFSGHDDKAQKAKAKLLAARAEARGCLFVAPAPPPAA
jgi:hypothetical protein